jgi:hypothetical protein
MANVKVNWTGRYPVLCHGEWQLWIDGVDYSDKIPKTLRKNTHMNTWGVYEQWSFDKNFLEIWETYEEGLEVDEWIEANASWLVEITTEEELMKSIYYAFQKQDWRHGQCGGCI